MRKFVIALLACVAVGTANADECNPLEAKFIVDAGWFFMSTDMRVRADGFRFDIEDAHDFDGRLRWDYGGAIAFASFMF